MAVDEPNESTPKFIIGFIFQKCEKKDPNRPDTSKCEGLSYSHALKLRAAISYHFAQIGGRGTEKWHLDRQDKDRWLGNPALSHLVSRYMISLQRRKVRDPLEINSAFTKDF
jgi:hypothetical protein